MMQPHVVKYRQHGSGTFTRAAQTLLQSLSLIAVIFLLSLLARGPRTAINPSESTGFEQYLLHQAPSQSVQGTSRPNYLQYLEDGGNQQPEQLNHPNITILLPPIPRIAPEYAYFTTQTCTKTLDCAVSLSTVAANTLPSALQYCLSNAYCSGVVFNPHQRSAVLCKRMHDTALQLQHNTTTATNKDCLVAAKRRKQLPATGPCRGPAVTDQGMIPDVLKNSCGVWSALEDYPSFNLQAQQVSYTITKNVNPSSLQNYMQAPLPLTAYNPSVVQHGDDYFLFLRVSNWTYCPEYALTWNYVTKGHTTFSTVAMCRLDVEAGMVVDVPSCRQLPLNELPVLPPTSDWGARVASIYSQEHPVGKGLEDPRPFVHNNKLYVDLIKRMVHKNFTVATPLNIEALQLSEASSVATFLVHDTMEQGHQLFCECENEKVQKNWMPVSVDQDELFYITRLSPLTVVRVTSDYKCQLAYKEPPPLRNYGAVAPGAGYIGGGSPFIRLNEAQFLAIVHSTSEAYIPTGARVFNYHQHLVLLSAIPLDSTRDAWKFHVEWLSDGFKMPRSPGFNPLNWSAGIQFSLSVAHYDAKDLIVAYGDVDCQSKVAIVPDFFPNINQYVDNGLGVHHITWSVDGAIVTSSH